MNIAMLSIHSSPLGELGKRNNGGMSVYITELAAELEKHGHRIDIFTLRRRGRHPRIVSMGSRTRLIHLDAGGAGLLAKTDISARMADVFVDLDIFRRQENRSYQLVHSHYWLSGQLGELLQDRWGVPHVMTFHSLGMVKRLVLSTPDEPDLRIALEKKLARTSDCVIVPTRRELNNMVAYYDAPTSNMALIPCGVNLDRFRPHPKKEARRKLQLPQEEALLLYVGRFTSEKGLDHLVEAIPLIDPRFRPRLVVVGGDGAEDEATRNLRDIACRSGLTGRVTFAGRIPNDLLPLYYSAADIMVLPSLYESFGLVALESLACGTPVVSTPVGALEHVILQGKTGEVVDEPGPRELSKGIDKMLARCLAGDPSQTEVRSSVRSFGWANIGNAVLREYFRLIEARRDPRHRTCSSAASIPPN